MPLAPFNTIYIQCFQQFDYFKKKVIKSMRVKWIASPHMVVNRIPVLDLPDKTSAPIRAPRPPIQMTTPMMWASRYLTRRMRKDRNITTGIVIQSSNCRRCNEGRSLMINKVIPDLISRTNKTYPQTKTHTQKKIKQRTT